MTREEAIYELKTMKTWSKDLSDDEIEALKFALHELNQKSREAMQTEPCEDAISRETVASEFADWFGYNYQNQFFYKRIKGMPSVQPEPFINKPCVFEQTCREDKMKVLEKIKTEIADMEKEFELRHDYPRAVALNYAISIINKYMEEGDAE